MAPIPPEMYSFASKYSLAYMATVDNGQPQLRAMNMWRADATGFYFHNNKKMDIWKQVSTNSKAHLLFVDPSGKQSLHVDGKLEFVPGAEAAFYAEPGKKMFEPRRTAIDPPIDSDKVIFRIAQGTAWFNPGRPAKWERVAALPQVNFP